MMTQRVGELLIVVFWGQCDRGEADKGAYTKDTGGLEAFLEVKVRRWLFGTVAHY